MGIKGSDLYRIMTDLKIISVVPEFVMPEPIERYVIIVILNKGAGKTMKRKKRENRIKKAGKTPLFGIIKFKRGQKPQKCLFLGYKI